ncbi:MAG: peptide chain release factor N(5)-glutamine methyltransferase [Oculatellaceae cyanobacterium Prado106]|jgi:release factor glutamine methyltransferase|nr:peptide chain release factor N(5)-glutamine methyltransferase [Oculatellaceae cyanobacterium Prado106]
MAEQISGLDLWQWRSQAQQSAIAHQIPLTEIDWLLQALTDLDRLSLRLESFKSRSTIPLKIPFPDLEQLWSDRLHQRVPLQYLIGSAPWRQFILTVSPAVLIPRPETEIIIDLAIAAAQHNPALGQGHWVDLGTGSGAIAIGLADALPQAQIYAVDLSEAALAIAKKNATDLGFAQRIQFHQGEWFTPITFLQGQLSGLVSNPPYIPHSQIATLQPEVTQHEPHLALDGGADGLDAIRQLVAIAPLYLQPGGWWAVEMMAGQGAEVQRLLEEQGEYEAIALHPDFAGIERFAIATRR